MSDNSDLQTLYKLHRDGKDKYTYFLLAATGASIGFALQKLEGLPATWWVLPGGLAILSWAWSFYCGCRLITSNSTATAADYTILQLDRGLHSDQPPAELVPTAIEGTRRGRARVLERGRWYMRWQFYLLLLGVFFFIAWRVLEMIRITPAN